MKNVRCEVTDFGVAQAAIYDFMNSGLLSSIKFPWGNIDDLVKIYMYANDVVKSKGELVSNTTTPENWVTVRYLAMLAEDKYELSNKNLYRVAIKPKHVEVLHLGLDVVDEYEGGVYSDTDALPKWVQERLAILIMMDSKPPTSMVEGIGKRISENVFWVYMPQTSVSV